MGNFPLPIPTNTQRAQAARSALYAVFEVSACSMLVGFSPLSSLLSPLPPPREKGKEEGGVREQAEFPPFSTHSGSERKSVGQSCR